MSVWFAAGQVATGTWRSLQGSRQAASLWSFSSTLNGGITTNQLVWKHFLLFFFNFIKSKSVWHHSKAETDKKKKFKPLIFFPPESKTKPLALTETQTPAEKWKKKNNFRATDKKHSRSEACDQSIQVALLSRKTILCWAERFKTDVHTSIWNQKI